jgi:hypothetical protein
VSSRHGSGRADIPMLDNPDDLIDGVAREMTAAQPSVDFTPRVIARVAVLESERGRRPRWQPVWLLASAAACVVVLAMLAVHDRLTRQPSVGPRSNAISRTAERLAPEPLPPVAEATRVTPRAQARPRASDARRRLTTRAVVATLGPDLAPLVTAPLEIEPLGVAPLAQAVPIEVDVLSIGRIDIGAMP